MGKYSPWARGELSYPWLHRQKSPHGSLIFSSLFKWGLQILAFWLVQKTPSWLVKMKLFWLVSADADGNIATQLYLDGKSLSPIGWNIIPGTPLAGLVQMAEQCRQGSLVWEASSSVQTSPSKAIYVRGCCLKTAARFCFLSLSPVSHQEPFLLGLS